METTTAKVSNIFTPGNGPTASEKMLMRVLLESKGQKTIDEIAAEIGKLRGKDYKRGSAVTAVSQLRARFAAPYAGHDKGHPFAIKGQSLEPKSSGGQGRKANREDMGDVLADLEKLVA